MSVNYISPEDDRGKPIDDPAHYESEGDSIGWSKVVAWAKRGWPILLALAILPVALTTSTYRPTDGHGLVPGLHRAHARAAQMPANIPSAAPVELLDVSQDDARRINALIPFSREANPPARPFRFSGGDLDRKRAIDCLASAGYYEAGADLEGQRAVAQVVLNRVRHPAFPSTVCGVVYQGSERRTGCQFTFTCDGAISRAPMPWLWAKSQAIAAEAIAGQVYPKVGLSTHYHTDWVVPAWSSSLEKVANVHTHLFFRWTGGWGRPGAFKRRPSEVEPFEIKLAGISPFHRAPDGDETPALDYEDTDTGAATPEKTPMQALASSLPAGINLRGAQLRLVHPQGGAFGFLLPRSYPGAFGLLALDICKGRSFCKVMGWTEQALIPKGFPIPYDSQRRMAFLHVHDSAQHSDITAWNCDIFPRPDKSQCLTSSLTQWDAIHSPPSAKF